MISVDPSSPFSHGALLGDRIRLAEHFTDPGVFIRSMASRGHLGGVAGATADAVSLMDAFGLDVVLIETVGVGQSEIEIAEIADTTLQQGQGMHGSFSRADTGNFTAASVSDPRGRSSGKLAVVVSTTPGNHLLGTVIFTKAPLHFGHSHAG